MDRGLFVSYRREDSESATYRLVDHLREAGFGGQDEIFLDIDAIPPGADFQEVIDDTLDQCDLVIVVIGRHWLEVSDDEGRRRIDIKQDTHRREVTTALERTDSSKVFPVLVEGAEQPQASELPSDLRKLARLNSWVVNQRTFTEDASALAKHLLEARRELIVEERRRHDRRLAARAQREIMGDEAEAGPVSGPPDDGLDKVLRFGVVLLRFILPILFTFSVVYALWDFFLGPQEIVDSWWELLTRAGTLVFISGMSFILSKDLENYRVLRQ